MRSRPPLKADGWARGSIHGQLLFPGVSCTSMEHQLGNTNWPSDRLECMKWGGSIRMLSLIQNLGISRHGP